MSRLPKPSKTAVVLFFVVAVAAFGLTKVTSALIQHSQIVSSTIDSTPIGSTAPAAGQFTSVHANGAANNPDQGAYLGWNMFTGSLGESDFVNRQGNGAGGYYWLNFTSAGQLTVPMAVDAAGNLTVASSISAPRFTGNVTGTLTGNASTATALANSPSQCSAGSGTYPVGIQANGNANCTLLPFSPTSPGYFVLPNNVVFEYGRTILPTGNGDFVTLPRGLSVGLFVVTASDAGQEGNPTASHVYSASAVVNQSQSRTGFYAYMKDGSGNYIGGDFAWIAIGE